MQGEPELIRFYWDYWEYPIRDRSGAALDFDDIPHVSEELKDALMSWTRHMDELDGCGTPALDAEATELVHRLGAELGPGFASRTANRLAPSTECRWHDHATR